MDGIVMLHEGLFLRCRKGGAAIEFAIVAPLFILTLLTLVAYAIYLNTAHAVQQIAADSARIAVAAMCPPLRSPTRLSMQR
jgi:Flp pilus assembly protein TadG